MRPIFGRLHRWAGLLTAAFLFFSGVTGAIISWDHEIDDVLNRKLLEVTSSGPAIPSVELARLIEHPATYIVEPAVIQTSQTAVFDSTIAQIGAPMRAM